MREGQSDVTNLFRDEHIGARNCNIGKQEHNEHAGEDEGEVDRVSVNCPDGARAIDRFEFAFDESKRHRSRFYGLLLGEY